MPQAWLRLYRDAVNSPKLQRLGLEAIGFWTNCLCLSDDDGVLPKLSELAWVMRVSETVAETFLKRLYETGLLDRDGDSFALHDWDEHQFKSDVSTERVKRFRQKTGNVARNVSETPQNRDRAEQIQPTAARENRAPTVLDLKTELWRRGVPYLVASGLTDERARGVIGKWRKGYGDVAVMNAIAASEATAASDPVAYVDKCLQGEGHAGRPGAKSQLEQLSLIAMRELGREP